MVTPAKDGSKHNFTTTRSSDIPPRQIKQENLSWDIAEYKKDLGKFMKLLLSPFLIKNSMRLT